MEDPGHKEGMQAMGAEVAGEGSESGRKKRG
jgi:hypothetical protein